MKNIVFTHEAGHILRESLQTTAPGGVFVLVDDTTREHCLGLFQDSGFTDSHLISVPAGEHHKSLESVAQIWSVLSRQGAKRNSVLVNIGGGLITDIGGFAASCFKRGIRCINIPTTLLAQVDASVGGKTGINFNGLKNEIGTFSIPELVIIDNTFLKTLPLRQVLSGYAEMLKHALLAGEEALAEVMNADLKQVGESDFLELIRKSVAVKAAVVEADPKEKGIRKALNFGHTIGHAIESVAIEQDMEIYHGDAVAYGMVVELYLSMKKLGFETRHYEAVRRLVEERFPRYRAVAGPEKLYSLMLHDKKNEQDGVNFTLLRCPGEFEIDNYCSKEEILSALEQLTV